MRQKLFAWGDDFTIKDDQGRDAFFVDGKVFTLGKQLSFQTMSGQELVLIRQQVFSWGPAYEIYRGGQLFATVKKQLFTFFNCTFDIDVPGPNDLQARGDFTDHEYCFTRNGQVIATASKQWFSWAESYGVDISPGEDDVLILACTVVIDMACHQGHDSGLGLGSLLGGIDQ
jgi:uncharacterized protein YxjI